ncbi:MAG: hypothetical protein BM555_06920 [Crocinitomix sp. MedPE-SWsnd]|nr:MAG: hypothetical protein BM555_06920 [Crocinitomix sp. MedPE-SWsnd]
MKKLFTLLLSSLAIGSFGQVVVYDIKPADFVSPFLELTSGDICSGSVEEAKQQSMGNTWGFTWTSTNSGTPASIQIDMYYTISDGGTAYATTLNSTASGTVDNVSAFSCTGASISSSWSISPSSYNSSALNTFMVDMTGSSAVNQFDNFPLTNDVYFQVTVDYTSCTAPGVSEALTDLSCLDSDDGEIDLTITGSGTYTFAWKMDGTPMTETTEDLTGLAPGEYTVLVDDGGCVTADTFQIANGTAVDVAVSQNKNTLTAQLAGATYQWIDCSDDSPIVGATSQTFTATSNGSYACIVTDGGCSDTSACSPVTSVGVEELKQVTLKLFPNPTSNEINLVVDGHSGAISYSLLNIAGKVIVDQSTTVQGNTNILIDMTKFETGVYFLKVNTTGNQRTLKIVKR